MAIKTIQRDNFGDFVSNRLQDHTSNFIDQISNFPFFNGTLLKDIYFPSGVGKVVDHKLGRKPEGYIITKRDGPYVIYGGALNDRTITLVSNGNVTVDIWMY